MRHFYIFKITSSCEKIWKKNPYELYHTLEMIYYRNEDDIYLGNKMIKQLIVPIAIKELDFALFSHFKNNYFYMKYKNIHSMHDVYRNENTILTLHKSYLKLDTNVIKPSFLFVLQKSSSFFVCDFEEKDYFWLDSFKQGAVFI